MYVGSLTSITFIHWHSFLQQINNDLLLCNTHSSWKGKFNWSVEHPPVEELKRFLSLYCRLQSYSLPRAEQKGIFSLDKQWYKMFLALSIKEFLSISRKLVIALVMSKSMLKRRLLLSWNLMFTSTFWNVLKQGLCLPLAQPPDWMKGDSQWFISNLSWVV